MGARILPLMILTLAVLLVISTSCFVVREQELALRVQLSRIVSSDYQPGLHFKIPFVEDVVKFDRRVLTVKFNGEKFLTRESQALNIDYYIKWRIREASLYYQSTGGDELRAGGLLGDRIQDGIKDALARRTLSEIVTSDRQQVTGEFMAEAGKSMSSIGVEIVDVRLQRIDLQEDVASSVYENMKRGFESIARMERGEGEKGKNILMAEADRKRTELVAKALSDAQRIRGEGEAAAAAIYAQAYNRNTEFYSFYRSLQAYRNSLGREGDVMVISPDSDFFRYLQNPAPQRR
jgi:modulator of FtsH protease HflC